MVGVGGVEEVDVHNFEFLAIEPEIAIGPFTVDVGSADYGRDLGGLLGLDFLRRAGAIINLADWTIDFAPAVQSTG
jgi:hypothetical protein